MLVDDDGQAAFVRRLVRAKNSVSNASSRCACRIAQHELEDGRRLEMDTSSTVHRLCLSPQSRRGRVSAKGLAADSPNQKGARALPSSLVGNVNPARLAAAGRGRRGDRSWSSASTRCFVVLLEMLSKFDYTEESSSDLLTPIPLKHFSMTLEVTGFNSKVSSEKTTRASRTGS